MADDSEFDDFYRGTSHRLLNYAYAMTGDLGTAQDLVQEAYIRAWQRWSRVRRYDRPEAWTRLLVARMATDRWRRLGVARRARAVTAWQPAPAAAPSDDTVLLVRALRAVREQERRALVLHYLMDLPISEIAVETDAPVGTVKSWLSRGRAALAAELGLPESGLPELDEARDLDVSPPHESPPHGPSPLPPRSGPRRNPKSGPDTEQTSKGATNAR